LRAIVTKQDHLAMSRLNEFDIVIRHKGGKVTAGIPQLAIYATADDVHAAITALEQKRTAFFGDLAEAGELADVDVRPYSVGRLQSQTESGIGEFVVKAVIVIGLIVATVVLSAALLLPQVERAVVDIQARMLQVTKVGGPEFWTKVERELERAAEPTGDLDDSRRKKILSQLHVIVERWRPFIAEIGPLFWEFQRPTSPPLSQNGK
jgi:hypothetical protein